MPPGRPTRILIVDDSAVMRSLLRSVIATDPGIAVAGTATDGASALASLRLDQPDLVLLDVEMPVMDGLITLREMRQRGYKMPVIMCSSLTQSGAKVTIEALAGGASDYVAKPAGHSSREQALAALAQELLPKIHALAGRGSLEQRAVPSARPVIAIPQPPPVTQPIATAPSVVAIGVSTGGPAALDVLLPALPPGFPLPVLIVQHMPEVFTRLLAERLNQKCVLRVSEASEGAPVQPGTVLIARGGSHMEVIPAARSSAPPTIRITQDPPENHCRPAADVLLRSAVRVYGSGVLAVILTGMGSDGLAGCRLIRGQGGSVIAQDQLTSTVWGMPGAVVQAGLAQRVLPLGSIAAEIARIAARFAQAAPLRNDVRQVV
jgi:two-component system, chemotaxis family, protein-glutamate methylesterase/glutaminase